MRKSIIEKTPSVRADTNQERWLDLGTLASVQVSSESPHFPIESALGEEAGSGWQAAVSGKQSIRILFDNPVDVHQIHLRFSETERRRTQEFVLCWKGSDGISREILRQQWNFNPDGSTSEVEDYRVELRNLHSLELEIEPDMSGGDAVASLAALRLA